MKSKHFILALSLTIGLILGCEEDSPEPLITNAKSLQFTWESIDQNYAWFENQDIDWDQIKLDFEGRVTEDMATTDYRDLLLEMLLLLKDDETAMEYDGQLFSYPRASIASDSRPVNVEDYLDSITTNTEHLIVGHVKDKNVRYIALKTMSEFVSEFRYQPVYDALFDMRSYDGLILDLRGLTAESLSIGYEVMRYLSNEQFVYRQTRKRLPESRSSFTPWREETIYGSNIFSFQNPIIVLTSRHIQENAETFTLMTRALPNALHLGDTTRGILGELSRYRIPHGWTLFVNNMQIADADGKIINGTGIVPDEAVQVTEADRSAGKDTILEAAIDKF